MKIPLWKLELGEEGAERKIKQDAERNKTVNLSIVYSLAPRPSQAISGFPSMPCKQITGFARQSCCALPQLHSLHLTLVFPQQTRPTPCPAALSHLKVSSLRYRMQRVKSSPKFKCRASHQGCDVSPPTTHSYRERSVLHHHTENREETL